jgi:hypothetical protein
MIIFQNEAHICTFKKKKFRIQQRLKYNKWCIRATINIFNNDLLKISLKKFFYLVWKDFYSPLKRKHNLGSCDCDCAPFHPFLKLFIVPIVNLHNHGCQCTFLKLFVVLICKWFWLPIVICFLAKREKLKNMNFPIYNVCVFSQIFFVTFAKAKAFMIKKERVWWRTSSLLDQYWDKL